MKFLNFGLKFAGEKQLPQLDKLEEFRLQSYESARIYKERTKRWHDRKITIKEFEPSQHVLLYNSRLRLFPGKLKSTWSRPFVVNEVNPYCVIEIIDPNSKRSFKINGQLMKLYLVVDLDRGNTTIIFESASKIQPKFVVVV